MSLPTPDSDPTRLLSCSEVADRLGVSYKTVRRLIDDEQLAVVRVRGAVRIHPDDLDAFIESQRTRARVDVIRPAAPARPRQRPQVRPLSSRSESDRRAS